MKVLSTALFLLCSLNFLSAQPVLTFLGQTPQPGDVLYRHFLDHQTVNSGPSGANVTWDLSNATAISRLDSGYFHNQLPIAVNFLANIAYEFRTKINGSYLPLQVIDYFVATTDSFSRYGMDHQVPDFHPLWYYNPAPLLRFPFTFGDSFSETFAGTHESISGTKNFTGVSNVHADGYGTLILPDTTWTDVLRIRVEDSITESGQTFLNSRCYNYYHASRRNPVLEICLEGAATPYARVQEEFNVPTSVQELSQEAVFVSPSPANQFVVVSTGGPAMVRLVDIHGRVWVNKKIHHQETIPTQSFPPGVYFWKISRPNGKELMQKQLIMH